MAGWREFEVVTEVKGVWGGRKPDDLTTVTLLTEDAVINEGDDALLCAGCVTLYSARCDETASEMWRPSGCSSYNPPTDSLDFTATPARGGTGQQLVLQLLQRSDILEVRAVMRAPANVRVLRVPRPALFASWLRWTWAMNQPLPLLPDQG